jgi:hypothetical protein
MQAAVRTILEGCANDTTLPSNDRWSAEEPTTPFV